MAIDWAGIATKKAVRAAIAITLAWAVRRILRSRSAEGVLGTGTRVLRYGSAFRLAGVAGLVASAWLIGFAQRLPDVRTPVVVFAALVALSQVALLTTTLRTVIEYDRFAIFSRSPWRGAVTLQWTEVIDVRFGTGMREFRLTGRDGGRVTVGMFMEGVGDFAAELPSLVAPNLCAEALAEYARQRGRHL